MPVIGVDDPYSDTSGGLDATHHASKERAHNGNTRN